MALIVNLKIPVESVNQPHTYTIKTLLAALLFRTSALKAPLTNLIEIVIQNKISKTY